MSDLIARLAEPPKRGKNGQFLPGTTLNPAGRPPLSREIRERCRDFMEHSGWVLLASIASDGTNRNMYRALELITAYAYGTPKQGVELTGEAGGPLEITALTPEERRRRIDELLALRAMDV